MATASGAVAGAGIVVLMRVVRVSVDFVSRRGESELLTRAGGNEERIEILTGVTEASAKISWVMRAVATAPAFSDVVAFLVVVRLARAFAVVPGMTSNREASFGLTVFFTPKAARRCGCGPTGDNAITRSITNVRRT